MTRILVMATALAAPFSTCYAQRADSAAGYSQRAAVLAPLNGQKEAERKFLSNFRDATKIKLPETEVPESPHDVSACLPAKRLEDQSMGYLDWWPLTVLWIAGPRDALLQFKADAPDIWLTDYPTKGLVDGQEVRLIGHVVIDGTRVYVANGGRRITVRAVRLATLMEVEEHHETTQADSKKSREASKRPQYRTWTDKNGKYSVAAAFVGFKNGKVRLKRGEKSIDVPMSKLSKADQEWVQNKVRSGNRRRQSY